MSGSGGYDYYDYGYDYDYSETTKEYATSSRRLVILKGLTQATLILCFIIPALAGLSECVTVVEDVCCASR